jgi:hypothetical protein
MNKRLAFANSVILAVSLLAMSAAVAQGTPTINWWLIGGGGAPSSGGNVTLNDTLGQPIIGAAAGGSGPSAVSLGAGYWYGTGPPTAVTLVAFWAHSLLNSPGAYFGVGAVGLIVAAGFLLFVARGRRQL